MTTAVLEAIEVLSGSGPAEERVTQALGILIQSTQTMSADELRAWAANDPGMQAAMERAQKGGIRTGYRVLSNGQVDPTPIFIDLDTAQDAGIHEVEAAFRLTGQATLYELGDDGQMRETIETRAPGQGPLNEAEFQAAWAAGWRP